MKLKLIMGLIGVLSLSSFSTLPSSDDTDKKPLKTLFPGFLPIFTKNIVK